MKRTILVSILSTLFYYVAYAGIENIRTSSELIIYENNKSTIDSILNQRISEELIRLNHFYNVPTNAYKVLKHYVNQRELKLISQDFLLADSLVQRVENKINIEQCYTDSINTILIPVEGNNISGENVSYALRCKDILDLDSIQYNYIMKAAINMARRIKNNYHTNLWNEEMEVLKSTLNKNQLQMFFRTKHAKKITIEFDEIMRKLNEAGVIELLDSVKDVPEAVNYLFNKQMIKDLYRNYSSSQKKHLSELDKNKPKIINMLDGLNKREMYKKEEKDKTVSKEFIW